jgi:hypothetical protein
MPTTPRTGGSEATTLSRACHPSDPTAVNQPKEKPAVPDDRQPVQSPLTLVMDIKSELDARALHQLLERIQSLPPAENPVVVALDKIATVHFARFVFLDDDTKLAVITAYDGDFATYINEFVNEIGPVFDQLLEHMADAPPLPVREHRREFLAYVAVHDVAPVGTFYSAYPSRTVLDILDQDGEED